METARQNNSAKSGYKDTGPPVRIPKGAEFMQTTLEKLEKMARREKDYRAKLRIEACIHRKRGCTIMKISEMLHMAYTTTRDCLLRMHLGGPGRRFNNKPGRKAGTTTEILGKIREIVEQLPEKYGFQAGSWQTGMVRQALKNAFGIEYSSRTIRRLLRKSRYSYRKPRSVPYNSASEGNQEKFQNKISKRRRRLEVVKYTTLTVDETTRRLSPETGYGWRPTNGSDTVKISYSQKSVKMIGALGRDTLELQTVDSTNSKSFVEFLKHLHCIYGKIYVLLDNASYHKSGIVEEYVKSTNGDVILEYLLPYT